MHFHPSPPSLSMFIHFPQLLSNFIHHVTLSTTLSTSLSSTPITTSNIISISIINRQSHISKVFSRYLHSVSDTHQGHISQVGVKSVKCRSPHRASCQPQWPASQSPPLTSSPWVSSIARVTSVKSLVVIFNHQGYISKVGSKCHSLMTLTIVRTNWGGGPWCIHSANRFVHSI